MALLLLLLLFLNRAIYTEQGLAGNKSSWQWCETSLDTVTTCEDKQEVMCQVKKKCQNTVELPRDLLLFIRKSRAREILSSSDPYLFVLRLQRLIYPFNITVS